MASNNESSSPPKQNQPAPTSPVTSKAAVPTQASFPGSTAPTIHGRNLWRAKYLDSLMHHSRFKQYTAAPSNCQSGSSWWCSWVVFLLYLPLGLVLLFLRIVVGFPVAGILSHITPTACSTCVFRSFACCCYGNCYRYKTVLPFTEEELLIEQELAGQAAPIMVANHTTEMDVLPIRSKGLLRIMGYDLYTKMKCLQFSPLKFLDIMYIKQTERSEGGGKDRDAVRQQVIDGLAKKGAPPLLVFPEGGLTNGKNGLLQFHKFLFSLNHCVQPIVIEANGGPLPINIDNNMGTTWGNILYYAFQPWQTFTVTYLPPQKRRSNEDALDFARRVMELIGKTKGIAASPFLYRDKRIYSKMKMKLFQQGFRYRFVNKGTLRGGRVHPEEDGGEEVGLPSIAVRTRCGCCTPNVERLSQGVDPLEYLASSIQEAFTDDEGKTRSQIFEGREGERNDDQV
jgi:1-acyl-sn-glycerol-3-phosphate acyltransferase